MMFAKFSGMPIKTQISSVTIPASKKWNQSQQNIAEASQNDPQQDGDRDERVESRFEERAHNGSARFKN